MKLSQHFTSQEFACGCANCQGQPSAREPMNYKFVKRLQVMREIFGQAMVISSGYRCPEHNRAVGGVAGSYHVRGRAADISLASSADRYELLGAAIKAGFTGIGIGATFLHVDDRDTTPVVWLYS